MSFIKDQDPPPMPSAVRAGVRAYVIEHLLLGTDIALADAPSLIEAGVLDSTGAMELVAFLEQEFAISVADTEIVPENLDSLDGIAGFVARKIAARQTQ